MSPAVSFPRILLLAGIVIIFSEIIKVALSILLSIMTIIFTAFFHDFFRALSPFLFHALNIIDLIFMCVVNIVALIFSVACIVLPWVVGYVLLKILIWNGDPFGRPRAYAAGL
ncbi:hypothetical protein F4776DRAFT_661406 [Hypoxylon sp. NC0597]|nr:hypothetical protein F4776DRAFT_661406 [Hypoxylon sp. NC0597]